jgi:ribosomal-protein-alanine N-acetyltransferase
MELAGFICCNSGENAGVLAIVLGMKPELTGRGAGQQFVESGIRFMLQHFPAVTQLELKVAQFNERAIRVYQKTGFAIHTSVTVTTNGNEYDFYEMRRDL